MSIMSEVDMDLHATVWLALRDHEQVVLLVESGQLPASALDDHRVRVTQLIRDFIAQPE